MGPMGMNILWIMKELSFTKTHKSYIPPSLKRNTIDSKVGGERRGNVSFKEGKSIGTILSKTWTVECTD